MEDLTYTAASPPLGGILERLLDEAERVGQAPSVTSSDSLMANALLSEGAHAGTSPAGTVPLGAAVAAPAPVGAVPPAGAQTVGAPPAGISPSGGGSSPLASLLGNPAVLSALPALMENLSPLLAGNGQGGREAPAATRPHSLDRHTALLCALKPYLSPHRRDTAETVIRLCRVWDALERSGISLTGLLGTLGGGGGTAQEGGNGHVQ